MKDLRAGVGVHRRKLTHPRPSRRPHARTGHRCHWLVLRWLLCNYHLHEE